MSAEDIHTTPRQARASIDAMRTALGHLRGDMTWVCSEWSHEYLGRMVSAMAMLTADSVTMSYRSQGMDEAAAATAAGEWLEHHIAQYELALLDAGFGLDSDIPTTDDGTPDN